MIKAIITDVDGVIVGKKHGVNFPLPNELVIQRLKDLHKKGMPIVLCTAKFNYAVLKIIQQADLRNPHITDGGALIIDPLDKKVIRKHIFDRTLAENIVSTLLAAGIYTECFGVEEYFLQKDHHSDFTKKRIAIIQKEHKAVDSLVAHVKQEDVIKILAFIKTDEEKQIVEQRLKPFMGNMHLIWSTHPALFPHTGAVITVKDVSKKHAALEVLQYLNISPEQTLGIGDTLGDWNFMSLCKYVATVGDESQELKSLAKSKGEGKYFIGSSVDENAFLEIVDYFT